MDIELRKDLPTVFAIEYRDARKALIGGTRPVVAHGMGWPEDDWQRVCEVKTVHGEFFARFFSTSAKWTQIDGLEVRR